MKNSAQSLAVAAAFAGLLGGTTVRMNAQTAQPNNAPATTAHAGVLIAQDKPDLPKHSCKGKGGCATDGSKPSLA